MGKEVLRFRGLTLNRDEQSADKGELSLCAGVELHDGALRASVLEGSDVENKLVATTGLEEETDEFVIIKEVVTLLYVHETASYRHFIGVADNALYGFDGDGSCLSEDDLSIIIHYDPNVDYDTPKYADYSLMWLDTPYVEGSRIRLTHLEKKKSLPIYSFAANDDIISVNSVGNTLVVMTTSGVHYILWKSDDEAYHYIGQQPPFVEMMFGLTVDYEEEYDRSTLPDVQDAYRQHPKTYDAWRILGWEEYGQNYFKKIDGTLDEVYIFEEKQAHVTESIWALINQSNHIVAQSGHFYAPFMIRYCYRLYDGSMIMHSSPVFMNVSHPLPLNVYCCNVDLRSDGQVIIIFSDRETMSVEYNGSEIFRSNKVTLRYSPNSVGITYRVNGTELDELKSDWSDIVKSLDIFITAPILREDSSQIIKSLKIEKKLYGARGEYLRQLNRNYVHTFQNAQYNEIFAFDIPMLSDEAYKQKVFDSSTFFKLKSFQLDDIKKNAWYDLDYDKNIVPNVTSQEQMKDDYHSHNKLIPISQDGGMYVYNHRLNLYGMKEQLFEGFSIKNMINNCDCEYPAVATTVKKIIVELNTEEGVKYVENDEEVIDVFQYNITKGMLFYPDSRACKMYIVYGPRYSATNSIAVLKMEPCNFLNGSVVTELFYEDDLSRFTKVVDPLPTVNDEVPMSNKVLTSEVDNPYYFPLEGRNTVGIGNIRGIAAVTRALSQGQVGDHDLVVFSTDGIWVMKVSKEGTYSATHNISREVCTNPKSICQLDQSVVFATERSLSRFVESNVVSMSDMLDGPIPNWSELLPSLVANFPDAEHQGTAQQQIINKLLKKGTPAVTLFNQGKVFYDYASSRVVVLPDGEPSETEVQQVALVFSTRDQTWSTMVVPKILAVVPGYPSPFVELSDGTVKILDKTYDYSTDDSYPALIITRELTFSDTMDVIQGFKQYADCAVTPKIWLYGSNDQRTWQPIGQAQSWYRNYLPGRPYRFFRIAVYMEMKQSEEYQQLLLEVVNKYAKL